MTLEPNSCEGYETSVAANLFIFIFFQISRDRPLNYNNVIVSANNMILEPE